MTDVKHLLEADQLPALIVHVVNHLPDYEAAVDALERLVEASRIIAINEVPSDEAWKDFEAAYDAGFAVLRRLREKVPA